MFRGVHVDARLAGDFRTRCHAAVLTQSPETPLSHRTAAAALGLPWHPAHWSTPDADIDLAVLPPRTRRTRRGLRLWERVIPPEELVVVDGLLCTSPARTLAELARERKMPALLVVQLLDGAFRFGHTTPEEIAATLQRLRGHAHVARARSLVERARLGVDSPQETKLRLTLEDGGVTGLETNIQIVEHDRLLARGELGDPRLLLWGEYDGFDVHAQQAVFDADRPRHRWLEARGWEVPRFANKDFDTGAIARDWLRAAARAPARIAAMPASRSPEVARARRLLGIDPPEPRDHDVLAPEQRRPDVSSLRTS